MITFNIIIKKKKIMIKSKLKMIIIIIPIIYGNNCIMKTRG